ncbi:hypothetical protein POM88_048182 [Heracleum sosnowskyi]|uniref:PHD-type domain-containing protein n=1 Tax=Heracleum sosnowskyi TaxID=360622 RepID=A0AAD8GVQ1_9APIA|nr:hypothetical protein POM88_048182 [Heracleum sosnowskyi]
MHGSFKRDQHFGTGTLCTAITDTCPIVLANDEGELPPGVSPPSAKRAFYIHRGCIEWSFGKYKHICAWPGVVALCVICKQLGATLDCSGSLCIKIYHLICASEASLVKLDKGLCDDPPPPQNLSGYDAMRLDLRKNKLEERAFIRVPAENLIARNKV